MPCTDTDTNIEKASTLQAERMKLKGNFPGRSRVRKKSVLFKWYGKCQGHIDHIC